MCVMLSALGPPRLITSVRRDMSTLSYSSSPDNGLSFDLLVDDATLGEVLGDGNEGIPYWIIEDDLPYWPPHGSPRDPDYRIVTVCSCGDYGCGHSRCRVTKTADSVTFHNFAGDVGPNCMTRVFTFPRSDYDRTVSGIGAEARRQKQRDGEQGAAQMHIQPQLQRGSVGHQLGAG